MKHQEVASQLKRLQHLFSKISTVSASTSDPEIQSHWAKYLCVLCCGFIENSLELFLADYASQKSSPRIQGYVVHNLRRFQNPSFERVMQLIGSFDPGWRDDVEIYAIGIDGKDAFDSLLGNRNSIAHGGTSGITYSRVKDYFDRSLKVLERIEYNTLGS